MISTPHSSLRLALDLASNMSMSSTYFMSSFFLITHRVCLYVHGCEVIHWSMGNLSVATPPKINDTPSSRNELPMAF